MSEPAVIDSYSGKYRFLSNFYPARVYLDDILYYTVEHGYQAAKTLDRKLRAMIQRMHTPGDAKQAGRTLILREDWTAKLRLEVMWHLLLQKFAPNTLLAAKLLSTGKARLIEGNTWGDTFWGVCNGVGHNHLGRMHEQLRDMLAAGMSGSQWYRQKYKVVNTVRVGRSKTNLIRRRRSQPAGA